MLRLLFSSLFFFSLKSSDSLDVSFRSSVLSFLAFSLFGCWYIFVCTLSQSVFFPTFVAICFFRRRLVYWCPVRCSAKSARSISYRSVFRSRSESFHICIGSSFIFRFSCAEINASRVVFLFFFLGVLFDLFDCLFQF